MKIVSANEIYNKYTTEVDFLREDNRYWSQIEKIALSSTSIKIPDKTSLSKDNSYGKNIYIVIDGKIARYQSIDFTSVSYRVIRGKVNSLDIKFPSGNHLVYVGDVDSKVFIDPIAQEDYQIVLKTKSEAEVLCMDLEYFKIIVGEFEFQRILTRLEKQKTDEEVINMWLQHEKERKWEKYKIKASNEMKNEIYGKMHGPDGTSIIRDYTNERNPSSLQPFIKRPIKTNCSSHLCVKKDFYDPPDYY